MNKTLKYFGIIVVILLVLAIVSYNLGNATPSEKLGEDIVDAITNVDSTNEENISLDNKEMGLNNEYIETANDEMVDITDELSIYRFYSMEGENPVVYEYYKNEIETHLNSFYLDIINGDYERAESKLSSTSALKNEQTRQEAIKCRELINAGHELEWRTESVNILLYGLNKEKEIAELSEAEALIFDTEIKQKLDDAEAMIRQTGLMLKENNQWKFYGYLVDLKFE